MEIWEALRTPESQLEVFDLFLAFFQLKFEKGLQAAHVEGVVDRAGADRATVEDNRLGVRLHSEVARGHRVFTNLALQ